MRTRKQHAFNIVFTVVLCPSSFRMNFENSVVLNFERKTVTESVGRLRLRGEGRGGVRSGYEIRTTEIREIIVLPRVHGRKKNYCYTISHGDTEERDCDVPRTATDRRPSSIRVFLLRARRARGRKKRGSLSEARSTEVIH